MQISGWKKAVLGIAATIVLGALGSGVWEIALRPGANWIWHGLLTGVTFGSQALKDKVYLEAAKGNHEEAAEISVVTLGWILSGLAGALIGFAGFNLRSLKMAANGNANDKLMVFMRSSKANRAFLWYVLMGTILVSAVFSIMEMEMHAANQSYTYFQQSMAICRPYITERQAQLFRSRFAALRTRKEYIEITNELKRVADTNHASLPEFTPW